MALATTTRDPTVILMDQLNYRTWELQLQSRCISYRVWDKINPTKTEVFMTKPPKPKIPTIPKYQKKTSCTTEFAEYLTDLSAAGLAAFKEDMELYKVQLADYKDDKDEYEKEQKAQQNIVAFIQSTVSPHLQRICCNPEKTLREWITNLQATVGSDDQYEKDRARKRYRRALETRNLTTTKWDIWLLELERAASEAEAIGLTELQDFHAVSGDFMEAASKITPTWVSAFNSGPRKLPTMKSRDMFKSFRETMQFEHPIKPKAQSAFHASEHGVFENDVALLAEDGGGEDAPNTAPGSQKRGRARQQRKAGKMHNTPPAAEKTNTVPSATGKISSASPVPGQRQKAAQSKRSFEPSHIEDRLCPACGYRHGIRECYYIHPDQAPPGWQGNPITEEMVNYRRTHDPEFQGLLRGQSRPRSRTPRMKSSHTPTPDISDQQ